MKNLYYQKVRGICILAVILIHCLTMPESEVYAAINIVIRKIIDFAVPIFIFLSGLFTNVMDSKKFYKKKVIRLIPALILWNIIYTFIFAITNNFELLTSLKLLLLSRSCPHLYYIYVLIQLFLIAPLLKKYILTTKNKLKIYMPLIITPLYNLFMLILWIIFKKNIPLYQYFIFGWFSYFYLGLLIRETKVKICNKNYVFNILLLICSIVEGMIVYFVFNNYSLAVTQLSFFNSLLCIMICIRINNKSKVINDNTNIINKIGDYSFGIYLSHILILRIVQKFISNLFILDYYTSIIVVFVLSVITCYILNLIYYKKVKNIIIKVILKIKESRRLHEK